MPRSVRFAILFSFFLHGLLIVTARYRASYDAYIHMFFADHYRMDWWSLWEARWYTGFFVSSYPPLVHQIIALLSRVTGLEAAFAIILWTTLTFLPLSVYAFTRVFTGRSVAGYASLGSAFLSSVYLTAHIFGQLATLTAAVSALFSVPAAARYLRTGDRLNGALAVACTATTMAFHHATLLLIPWLILAMMLHLLSNHQVSWKPLIIRLSLLGFVSALAMLLVVWPFWDWGRTQSIQTPIDHLSRHNFLKDPLAPILFFLPMYSLVIFVIPFAVRLALKCQFIGLGIPFIALFLLGLGGTTPLPRLLFGAGWEWLTYDRFAFWASLLLLPFFGAAIIVIRKRSASPTPRKKISLAIFGSLAAVSLFVGSVSLMIPLQPGAVAMKQIVDFLDRDDRARYRYVTFGFGDQLALLSTLTTATTIDGSYHTARGLPELRTSGIGQIDTAYWSLKGLPALDPILQKAGSHGVRWGFVNVPQYIPVLERNGWVKVATLEGGVQFWENPDAILPEPAIPPPVDSLASFSWGTLPLLALVFALSLAAVRLFPAPAQKTLRGSHAFLVGLIPVSLCFWYYRTIGEFAHSRVYFTYDHALFFVSDVLALLAVVFWLSARIAAPVPLRITNSRVLLCFSLLIALTSFSTLWSRDWRTSIYISLHFWLVFLLILSLRDWRDAWKPAMLGLCAALSIQFIAGFVGFAAQSTAFLDPLKMKWPGALDPAMRGASVVQLSDGSRFLRAYGTLPHPNILGGFVLFSLLGPANLFLANDKPNRPALILFSLGIILLGLTFSRSAWVGLFAFLIVLILKSKHFDRRRLLLFIATGLLTTVLTLYPLRDLVSTRLGSAPAATEQLSTSGRNWLTGQAMATIQEHPLTGVGIGSFVIELSNHTIEGALIEPVHNLLLLAASELGIPGALLVIGLYAAIALDISKARTPNSTLAGATLAGLGVVSLFDHYLWTLAPGRLMFGLALGLFAGQIHHAEA